MTPKPKTVWSDPSLFGLALLLLLACATFHLKAAWDGHPIYRDQHIGTALEYYKHGIDLFRPMIIGFNANNAPTPQEFPIWQAMTAVFFKMFGPWLGWGTVVSLLCMASALYPLYRLARDCGGNRVAVWTLIFFLAQPLIFIMAGKGGTDGFSEVTQIWYLYYAVRLLARPGVVNFIAATFFATLCAVSKLPFYMSASIGLALLLFIRHRNSAKAWIGLVGVGVVSGVIFMSWTHYTDRCLDQAKLIFVDLRLSNKDMVTWYFGDAQYRRNPANWIRGGWRMLNCCFGSFLLIGLPLYALCFLRRTILPKALLAGVVITTAIFTHLVLHHQNYYLMLTPAVALLCGLGATDLEKRLPLLTRAQSVIAFAGVILVLALSVIQGMIGMKVTVEFDSYEQDMAKVVAGHVKPDEKILILQGGWGGNVLMLSEREGLSILNTKFLEDPEKLKQVKEFGYTKLVMLSESPLVVAAQMINPGGAHYQRITYEQFLSPVAKSWPVEFQTDDILIKNIPK